MYQQEWQQEQSGGTAVGAFAKSWDIHRSTHWRRIHGDRVQKPRAFLRTPPEKIAKVIELDRRTRYCWSLAAVAQAAGVSPTTASKIRKTIHGEKPKPRKVPHRRRTRFLLRDVMWSSDFVELPDKSKLLKTLDETSRFRLGWSVAKSESEEAVVRHAQDLFRRMERLPLVWKFDHGSGFISAGFRQFLENHGVQPYPIPPRAPWAQGRVERDHQEILTWLRPLNWEVLTDEEKNKEVDDGMFLLNFSTPRQMMGFKTSAEVYFHTDGVEQVDREQLRLNLEKIKCQLGSRGGERLQRKAIRQLLQNWGFYEEWEEMQKGAKSVNRSVNSNVAF